MNRRVAAIFIIIIAIAVYGIFSFWQIKQAYQYAPEMFPKIIEEKLASNPDLTEFLVVNSPILSSGQLPIQLPNEVNGVPIRIVSLSDLRALGVTPETTCAVRFDAWSVGSLWQGNVAFATAYGKDGSDNFSEEWRYTFARNSQGWFIIEKQSSEPFIYPS